MCFVADRIVCASIKLTTINTEGLKRDELRRRVKKFVLPVTNRKRNCYGNRNERGRHHLSPP